MKANCLSKYRDAGDNTYVPHNVNPTSVLEQNAQNKRQAEQEGRLQTLDRSREEHRRRGLTTNTEKGESESELTQETEETEYDIRRS